MDIKYFRVSDDRDSIEFYVEIPDNPGYENLVIDKIAIQDHKHYTVGYPTTPQIELTSVKIEPFDIIDGKSVMKVLFLDDLKLVGNLSPTGLYFMYVHQAGIPGMYLDCSVTKETYIAVAINLIPIYNKAIKLISSIKGNCPDAAVKADLVDIAWKKDLFKQAIFLEDYQSAITIYDELLAIEIDQGNCLNGCTAIGTRASENGCGCN